jgi:hypothetical protein
MKHIAATTHMSTVWLLIQGRSTGFFSVRHVAKCGGWNMTESISKNCEPVTSADHSGASTSANSAAKIMLLKVVCNAFAQTVSLSMRKSMTAKRRLNFITRIKIASILYVISADVSLPKNAHGVARNLQQTQGP